MSKEKTINHLSNISFSPFYTVSENTISAELLSYLTVIFLLWKPNIWALLSVRKSHNRIPQSMIWNFSGGERASMFRFLPFVIVGQLNWRDPLGHHPTLWYILQYELWIDFIYTQSRHRKVKCWMEMGFFDSSTKWILHKIEERQWKPLLPHLNLEFQLRDFSF